MRKDSCVRCLGRRRPGWRGAGQRGRQAADRHRLDRGDRSQQCPLHQRRHQGGRGAGLGSLGDRRGRQRRPGQCRHPEFRAARRPRHCRHGVPVLLDRRRARRGQERRHPGRHLGRRSRQHGCRHQRLGRPDGDAGHRDDGQGTGRQGQRPRAHLSHRRSVPEPRGGDGRDPRQASRHQGDQERSAHPRLFRGRRAICQCLAGLPSRRRGAACHLGLLG